jgi:hypothetical protein
VDANFVPDERAGCADAYLRQMPDEFRMWLGRGHALGTIHQRIFKDIETRLLSGEWRPGDRIPIEHDLVAQYQCSRMKVSKALSILV